MAIAFGEARALLGVGFAVWLVATVAIRHIGHWLFDPTAPLVVAGVFVVTVPVMAALTLAIFRCRATPGGARPVASMLLVLPGMVLDSLVLPMATTVFPNLPAASVGSFGGLLLLAYVVVLAVGLLSSRR